MAVVAGESKLLSNYSGMSLRGRSIAEAISETVLETAASHKSLMLCKEKHAPRSDISGEAE